MISTNDYPLFIPPENLAIKEPRNWSKHESNLYFEWLLREMSKRINDLLIYLEENVSDSDIENDLLRIGEKVAQLLKSEPFSRNGDLTNVGYALAADMGLLVGKLLQEACPSVHWVVLRKPKSDLSYNLPVLSGFGPITLDPVGGSIAETIAILSGSQSASVWKDIYSFWREKAVLC